MTLVPLDTIFEVFKGNQLALTSLKATTSEAGVAFVARSHRNNGVTAWVEYVPGVDPSPAGSISVALRSRNHALAAHVQPREFYTTYHVAVLTPRKPMSLPVKLWYCRCIEANRFRFNFGRQANRTIETLLIPSKPPRWASAALAADREAAAATTPSLALDPTTWTAVRLDELFDLAPGQFVKRRDLPPGDVPFVTAADSGNGVTARVGIEPDWPGGQITVANNGNGVGTAFYQPRPFAASRDVTILDPKTPLSPAAALFICVAIQTDRFRWNYARKWNTGRMRKSLVRLPFKDGSLDIGYMDSYVHSLPLGSLLP